MAEFQEFNSMPAPARDYALSVQTALSRAPVTSQADCNAPNPCHTTLWNAVTGGSLTSRVARSDFLFRAVVGGLFRYSEIVYSETIKWPTASGEACGG